MLPHATLIISGTCCVAPWVADVAPDEVVEVEAPFNSHLGAAPWRSPSQGTPSLHMRLGCRRT
jgi:hypothetical protein